MPDYDAFTTLEQLADGNITLVGEDHQSDDSAHLAERVYDDIEPNTVCFELPSHGAATTPAMRVGWRYAKDTGAPRVNIDQDRSLRRNLDCNNSALIEKANTFTYGIEDDGDVDPRSIINARNRIRQRFGDEAYHRMYTDREAAMAERLRWVHENLPQPTVVHIGAFHIHGLRDMWFDRDSSRAVGDERIRDPRATSTTETTEAEA